MSKKLIYAVDDEVHIRELLAYNLAEAGYEAAVFEDAPSLLEACAKRVPALILLDIMLPGMSGMEACRELKGSDSLRQVPVIFLTAKSDEFDKVLGLEMGADDYLSKPFGVRELLARIKTVLRRCEAAPGDKSAVIAVQDVVLDNKKRTVTQAGRELSLTLKEFELLRLLMMNKGHVLTRDVLLDSVWGYEYVGETRTVDVHILKLRKLLSDDSERYIETVRGVGYKFRE